MCWRILVVGKPIILSGDFFAVGIYSEVKYWIFSPSEFIYI